MRMAREMRRNGKEGFRKDNFLRVFSVLKFWLPGK